MSGSGSERSLRAVILDVDGTLVDSERDGHRVAFNLAFEELGLHHRWSEEEYGELLAITGGSRRLSAYLGSHGMPEDQVRDLVPRLHRTKTDLFQRLVEEGRVQPRPGVPELIDELAAEGVRLAVATTGSAAWVHPLLDQLFGLDRFEVILTGDEVEERKPHPEAHRATLERLGLTASQAVAVEDSDNGLAAAKAAEVPCVVVVNAYTRHHDFDGASLVLDGFGSADGPPGVLSDPFGLAPEHRLDVATFERVARHAAAEARR